MKRIMRLLCLFACYSFHSVVTGLSSFLPGSSRKSAQSSIHQKSFQLAAANTNNHTISFSYLQRLASSSSSRNPTNPQRQQHHLVLLIHPVGIGLANWFWEPLLQQVVVDDDDDSIDWFAPNLLGCENQEQLNDDEDNLPWFQQCIAFLESLLEQQRRRQTPPLGWRKSPTPPATVTVVTQGGLSPLGIQLLRDTNAVDRLILLSPSTEDPVDQASFESNRFWLTSRIGNWGLAKLEASRAAIRFFSNNFLFESDCDNEWVERCRTQANARVRKPVQLCNAGYWLRNATTTLRDDEEEGRIVVVVGRADTRRRRTESNTTSVRFVDGRNVLPWENPQGIYQLIRDEVMVRSQ